MRARVLDYGSIKDKAEKANFFQVCLYSMYGRACSKSRRLGGTVYVLVQVCPPGAYTLAEAIENGDGGFP